MRSINKTFALFGWTRKKQRHIKRSLNKCLMSAKCEEVRCPYGAKCRPYSGQCECRSFCNTAGPAVCGTDNVSYLSECHLAVRSCLAHTEEKSEIRVKKIGACVLHIHRKLVKGLILWPVTSSI
ncbi:unnamed protein product [Onchocerca flexuosa]|uniref:Kazal-like domain-containing protein n=1 Tax=Onchocerca flexuosa TaxID=387005 RepID=A0A183HEH1_9BILA|nr:unnamed protein product [Onchocerca flexuosa]